MRRYHVVLILLCVFPGIASAAPQRFSPPPIAPKGQVKNAQPHIVATGPTFFPLDRARLSLPRNTKNMAAAPAPVKPAAKSSPPMFEMPNTTAPQETASMTPEMAQQLLSIYPALD